MYNSRDGVRSKRRRLKGLTASLRGHPRGRRRGDRGGRRRGRGTSRRTARSSGVTTLQERSILRARGISFSSPPGSTRGRGRGAATTYAMLRFLRGKRKLHVQERVRGRMSRSSRRAQRTHFYVRAGTTTRRRTVGSAEKSGAFPRGGCRETVDRHLGRCPPAWTYEDASVALGRRGSLNPAPNSLRT